MLGDAMNTPNTDRTGSRFNRRGVVVTAVLLLLGFVAWLSFLAMRPSTATNTASEAPATPTTTSTANPEPVSPTLTESEVQYDTTEPIEPEATSTDVSSPLRKYCAEPAGEIVKPTTYERIGRNKPFDVEFDIECLSRGRDLHVAVEYAGILHVLRSQPVIVEDTKTATAVFRNISVDPKWIDRDASTYVDVMVILAETSKCSAKLASQPHRKAGRLPGECEALDAVTIKSTT